LHFSKIYHTKFQNLILISAGMAPTSEASTAAMPVLLTVGTEKVQTICSIGSNWRGMG